MFLKFYQVLHLVFGCSNLFVKFYQVLGVLIIHIMFVKFYQVLHLVFGCSNYMYVCEILSGAASSGDIDIILGHPDYTSESSKKPPYIRRVVQRMEAANFVTDTLSLGETKFMVSSESMRKPL